MGIEAAQDALDDTGRAQGKMGAQTTLGTVNKFQDEQVVEQGPALTDEDGADGPGGITLVDGFSKEAFGDVDGFAGETDVEGLVIAHVFEDQEILARFVSQPTFVGPGIGGDILKDQEVFSPHKGDADAIFEKGVDEVFGEFIQPPIKKEDERMAGVKAGQFLVFREDAVAQPGLLAKDDGFGKAHDFGIDLGVGDVAFTQAAVGTVIIGAGGNNLCRHIGISGIWADGSVRTRN